MDDILFICMCQSISRNLGTMSFTLQMVLKCFTFLGREVCAKLLLFNPMLLTTSPQADQLGTYPTHFCFRSAKIAKYDLYDLFRCKIIIYEIWDGLVQEYVLLAKLACDVHFPNATKIHNAMRCWRLLRLHTWSMPRDVDTPCTYTLVGAARCRPNVLSSATRPL